jgi:DNA-binding NtrC family response regulator
LEYLKVTAFLGGGARGSPVWGFLQLRLNSVQTILVVDNEMVIREGCRRLPAQEGYEDLTAENGKDALDLLSTESLDLILCDLVMPVMGALEVLEEVKAHYPDLPLIIVAGHGTVADADEAMQKGAYDFVTKPFRADHLIQIVKSALERRDMGYVNVSVKL